MKKIFVNGSFDILHTGHLNLIEYARSLGDHLQIAIDSDQRIKYNKGNDRPFNNIDVRYKLISMLSPVDSVRIFNSDEELINIIKEFSPDIMVKGDDWKGKPVIGSEFCKQILYYERNNESTTKTIEDFINRRQLL